MGWQNNLVCEGTCCPTWWPELNAANRWSRNNFCMLPCDFHMPTCIHAHTYNKCTYTHLNFRSVELHLSKPLVSVPPLGLAPSYCLVSLPCLLFLLVFVFWGYDFSLLVTRIPFFSSCHTLRLHVSLSLISWNLYEQRAVGKHFSLLDWHWIVLILFDFFAFQNPNVSSEDFALLTSVCFVCLLVVLFFSFSMLLTLPLFIFF